MGRRRFLRGLERVGNWFLCLLGIAESSRVSHELLLLLAAVASVHLLVGLQINSLLFGFSVRLLEHHEQVLPSDELQRTECVMCLQQNLNIFLGY